MAHDPIYMFVHITTFSPLSRSLQSVPPLLNFQDEEMDQPDLDTHDRET